MNTSNPKMKDWLTAHEAATFLDVKKPTLYAYVSRGLVRSRPQSKGRGSEYASSDLQRVKARSDARSGHHAVAAGALRWGQPVLDSYITQITSNGPSYRGVLATSLIEKPFQDTVRILWEQELVEGHGLVDGLSPLSDLVDEDTNPLDVLLLGVSLLRLSDDDRVLKGNYEIQQASRILRSIPVAIASRHSKSVMKRVAKTSQTDLVGAFAQAFGIKQTKRSLQAINTALVLIADHELNPSSFASRVTASVDGDLYACVMSALSTLSGPKHGGVSASISDLIEDIGAPAMVARRIKRGLSNGTHYPGFAHPLYPEGDPRSAPMFASVSSYGGTRLNTLRTLCDTMELATGARPTVDMGLSAISLSLKLGRDGAIALFAAGRCAGWLAHAMEQRSSGFSLRPRARYIGA